MSLLRTAARTAVIAGAATRIHHRVAARQRGTWAASTAAPTPPVTPPVQERSAVLQQLRELGGLRDSGVLTEAEFEAEKAKILRGA